MSRPGTKVAILAGTFALAGFLPATVSAGGGLSSAGQQQATASLEVETLASYMTKGKLKVQRKLKFLGVCSAECNVAVSMTLVVPGPNVIANPPAMTFAAGQVFQGFIDLTKPGVAFLKENKSKSKLVTKIQAINTVTGDTDTDKRNFKFK
jgi:hypothetical protein